MQKKTIQIHAYDLLTSFTNCYPMKHVSQQCVVFVQVIWAYTVSMV